MKKIKKEDILPYTEQGFYRYYLARPLFNHYMAICKCGRYLVFSGRKPYETVKLTCPKCGFEIIYG